MTSRQSGKAGGPTSQTRVRRRSAGQRQGFCRGAKRRGRMKDSDKQSPAREARRGDVVAERRSLWSGRRARPPRRIEFFGLRRGDSDEQAERECGEASAGASGTEKGRGMSCCERRKRKQARRCCETEKGRGSSASGERGGRREAVKQLAMCAASPRAGKREGEEGHRKDGAGSRDERRQERARAGLASTGGRQAAPGEMTWPVDAVCAEDSDASGERAARRGNQSTSMCCGAAAGHGVENAAGRTEREGSSDERQPWRWRGGGGSGVAGVGSG